MAEPQGEDAIRRSDHKHGAPPVPSTDAGNGNTSYRPASYSTTGQPRVAPRGYDRERRVDSLIDGMLGGANATAEPATHDRASSPASTRRPPLTWPPRPATQASPAPTQSPAAPFTTPAVPAGDGLHAYAPQRERRTALGERIVRPGNWTYRGLRSRTRVVLGLLVAAAMVAAAVITANLLSAASATNFSAAIAPDTIVGLNFPTTGTITSIDVQPGQWVQAGQLLATIDNHVIAQQVNTDEIQLASDNQGLAALLGASGKTEAAQAQQILDKANQQTVQQQQQAAARVAAATNVLNNADAALQVAQNQQTTDQDAYTSDCTASASTQHCATLQRDLTHDAGVIQQDQAKISSDQAALNAADGLAGQLGSLTSSEENLAKQAAASGTPTLENDIRLAGDAVTEDQTKLAADQAAMASDDLFADDAGQVVAVNGVQGKLAGGSGVRSNPNGTNGGSSGTNGSSTSPSAATTAVTPSGIAPLIEINVGTEAVAQVPEAHISSIHIGEAATVTINALGGSTLKGVVTSIGEQPINSGGAVYYDVYVSAPNGVSWPAAVKDGMTANVKIG